MRCRLQELWLEAVEHCLKGLTSEHKYNNGKSYNHEEPQKSGAGRTHTEKEKCINNFDLKELGRLLISKAAHKDRS